MAERLPQKSEIGVTEVRKNLGKLLNQVHRGEEHVVVEKLGTPIAAIISITDYEQYRQLLAQKMHRELGRADGEPQTKEIFEKLFLNDGQKHWSTSFASQKDFLNASDAVCHFSRSRLICTCSF